jgi:hypothetical protein
MEFVVLSKRIPMEFLLHELFRFIIIFGLAFVCGLVLLKVYINRPKSPSGNPLIVEEQKIILPLRLQAYERLVLYLERITPNNLIMRLNRPELNAAQFQSLLVKTIREEFEYNLSQQLYISPKAWELVKNAKEETINLINQASSKLPENASSAELARVLFDQFLGKEKLPVDRALDEVKQEIQKSF